MQDEGENLFGDKRKRVGMFQRCLNFSKWVFSDALKPHSRGCFRNQAVSSRSFYSINSYLGLSFYFLLVPFQSRPVFSPHRPMRAHAHAALLLNFLLLLPRLSTEGRELFPRFHHLVQFKVFRKRIV